MRVRTSLILEEALLKKIDEIAVEKHRRATVIETALREFIDREEKKARTKPAAQITAKAKAAASAKR